MIYDALNTVPELIDWRDDIKQYIAQHAVGSIYICGSCKRGINICREDIYNDNNQFLRNTPQAMLSQMKFDA